MRDLLILILFIFSPQLFAQLSFCEGSKGDPIFQENFGSGNFNGPPLPSTVTNYTYVTGDPQDGEYTISGSIGSGIDSWHSYLPNGTVSGGRALIVNASFSSGRFYQKEINGLCENTTYEFSAYLINIYNRSSVVCDNGGIPVNVRFEIWDESNSVLLKEGSTGAIPSGSTPQWEQYALTFQSRPGQESVILKMYNNGEGGCGNDLAIDDIIFRSCGDLTNITREGNEGSQLDVCEIDAPVSVVLTATPDFSVYTRHAFQWQDSNDNENWNDIAGETEVNYTTPLLNSSKYYRVKVAEDEINLRNNLCSSASEAFLINIVNTPQAPESGGDRVICSNRAIPSLSVEAGEGELVNWFDSPAGGSMVAEGTTTFTPPGAGIFYAEAIKRNFNCTSGPRTAVSLTINEAPEVEDEILYWCRDSTIILDAGVGGMNYLWSTGETNRQIEVASSGNYTVNINTPQGCTASKSFEIIAVDIAEIEEVISEERKVEVIPANEGTFEYSLDGRNFQQSNIFEPVSGGIYTVYMRDLSGCRTVSKEFAHLVFPKFITPNNDGYNDFFELKGISFFETSEIKIFDRYGKLLKFGEGRNIRWDGTFNGKNLPADDYWYEISIQEFGTVKGNFTLLR